MTAYILRRLLLLVPTAAGMVIVTFGLLLLLPGDPASVLLGQEATPEAVEQLRRSLGLDDPWHVRLGGYFVDLVQGDMGQSIFQNQPVSRIILGRLGATVELALVALLLASALGVLFGMVAAIKQGTAVDTALMLFSQLGISMPAYWLGILLMLVFAVNLGWLPAIGRGVPLAEAVPALLAGNPQPLSNALSHLALPALTLALNSAAIISRLVRMAMLEVIRDDFVRTAYAKGLRRPRVMIRHVLRNALLPIISIIGLRFGVLLGGAVITETIFGWPGLGQLTITAISQRDITLIQGIVLTFALMFALVNLMVDILYAVVDPRVRLG